MDEQTKTLEQSIRELGDETFSATPSGIRHPVYLDPRGWRVYPSTHVGPGMPMPAWEGRHHLVCNVPPGAIPASVVEQLLPHLDTMVEACIEVDDALDTEDDVLASAAYELSNLELDFVCYWDPCDFYSPVWGEIRDYATEGLSAEAIVDRLGTDDNGHECVDRDAAIAWVEDFIADGVAEGQIELPESKSCYGCNRPLDPHAGLSVAYCGQCGEVGR
jgi:hypothetical protein